MMISNKHLSKITAITMAFLATFCFVLIATTDDDSAYAVEYEEKLFNTDTIISVDIFMDASQWDEMLKNAMLENYYSCTVIINGNTIKNVGIRPKGNTSLSAIARDSENDRYSFKLEFDKYITGQTCFGLDKLVLNNNYADVTAMKEAIIYDMFHFLGADAPLYNYAKVSLNGKYFGTYLALEAVEESFMLRNYGAESGSLYKPDGMNRNGDKLSEGMADNPPSFGEMPMQGGEPPTFGEMTAHGGDSARKDNKNSFHSRNSGGANLNYTDDSLDSYSAIWEGAVTSSSKADHARVITALKNIHTGASLENYLDIDNVLKYMAVHSFSVNQDSLSGNMAHNYYLYESNGKLNIIPWDYNLAFGGMGVNSSNGATGVINDAIDTPFAATDFFDSLLKNNDYLNRYHEYYSKLVNEYVFGGLFDTRYSEITSQIDELIKTDPNSMYSYEDYETAKATFYDVILLRGESVKCQLNGVTPSTDEEQKKNSTALIDASHINLPDMGTMGNVGERNKNKPFELKTEGESLND